MDSGWDDSDAEFDNSRWHDPSFEAERHWQRRRHFKLEGKTHDSAGWSELRAGWIGSVLRGVAARSWAAQYKAAFLGSDIHHAAVRFSTVRNKLKTRTGLESARRSMILFLNKVQLELEGGNETTMLFRPEARAARRSRRVQVAGIAALCAGVEEEMASIAFEGAALDAPYHGQRSREVCVAFARTGVGFRRALLNTCLSAFNSGLELLAASVLTQGEGHPADIDVTSKWLRMQGVVHLIRDLYLNGQLSVNIMCSCLRALCNLDSDSTALSEQRILLASKLLLSCGPNLKQDQTASPSVDVSRTLQACCNAIQRSVRDGMVVSSQCIKASQLVQDLRDKGWPDRTARVVARQREALSELVQVPVCATLGPTKRWRRSKSLVLRLRHIIRDYVVSSSSSVPVAPAEVLRAIWDDWEASDSESSDFDDQDSEEGSEEARPALLFQVLWCAARGGLRTEVHACGVLLAALLAATDEPKQRRLVDSALVKMVFLLRRQVVDYPLVPEVFAQFAWSSFASGALSISTFARVCAGAGGPSAISLAIILARLVPSWITCAAAGDLVRDLAVATEPAMHDRVISVLGTSSDAVLQSVFETTWTGAQLHQVPSSLCSQSDWSVDIAPPSGVLAKIPLGTESSDYKETHLAVCPNQGILVVISGGPKFSCPLSVFSIRGCGLGRGAGASSGASTEGTPSPAQAPNSVDSDAGSDASASKFELLYTGTVNLGTLTDLCTSDFPTRCEIKCAAFTGKRFGGAPLLVVVKRRAREPKGDVVLVDPMSAMFLGNVASTLLYPAVVATSKSGNYAAIGCQDGMVHVFMDFGDSDLTAVLTYPWAHLYTFAINSPRTSYGLSPEVLWGRESDIILAGLQFAADGEHLAVLGGTGSLDLFSVHTGMQVQHCQNVHLSDLDTCHPQKNAGLLECKDGWLIICGTESRLDYDGADERTVALLSDDTKARALRVLPRTCQVAGAAARSATGSGDIFESTSPTQRSRFRHGHSAGPGATITAMVFVPGLGLVVHECERTNFKLPNPNPGKRNHWLRVLPLVMELSTAPPLSLPVTAGVPAVPLSPVLPRLDP